MSAASPDGRRVSAQATPALPIASRSPPTIAAARHSRQLGRFPRAVTAYSSAPAIRNRADDISSGGIDRSVMRIAR